MKTVLLKISHFLLIIEALILIYPTYVGGYIAYHCITDPGNRPWLDILIGLLILTGLTAGWRLLFWAISNGPLRTGVLKTGALHPAWPITALLVWLSCLLVAAASWLLALADITPTQLDTLFYTGWLGLLLFTIPYFHLLLHIRWQKALAKYFQDQATF